MLSTESTITQTREELFINLYQSVFPGVASFIRKRGGNSDEARDIFQDALLIYYEKTQGTDFNIGVSREAYLAGICKHLWYKKHRKQNTEMLDDNLDFAHAEEQQVSERLMRFVERSGKKCLELLKAFYYDRLNMKELSDAFGFSGERSATVQKHKCLEKVRNGIREKSLQQEDFYE